MSYPGKGRADYLALGDWNVVCYQCGRKRKASTMKKHWQGYYVCPEHWEIRQPQDFVRSLPDVQTPPWVQPIPAPLFVNFCSPNGMSCVIDFAVVDCCIVDFISSGFNPSYEPPACIPLIYTAPTTVADTEWGCTALVISTDLTLTGMIGVY